MFKANDNYLKLPGDYLFSEIASRIAAYGAQNPDKAGRVVRLGIGDVTQPLAPSIVEALHAAVDEMGDATTFRGYAPDLGYDFLRETIAEGDFKSRGALVEPDEVFVSDGAKSDCANIQEIFSADARIAVCDPVYPVYVDSNVMAGRTGTYDAATGLWSDVEYMPCTREGGFTPRLPDADADVSLVYLCFPNNPTGDAVLAEALRAAVFKLHPHQIAGLSHCLTRGGGAFASLEFQTGDSRRAEVSGVRPERGEFNNRVFRQSRERSAADLFPNALNELFAQGRVFQLKRHASADKNPAGVNRVHEGNQPQGDVSGGVHNNSHGDGVAFFRLLSDQQRSNLFASANAFSERGRLVRFEDVFGSLNNGCGRRVRFQMPQLSARAFSSVFRGIDENVSALGSVPVFALDNQVADDNSAADASAQREHNHRMEQTTGTDPELSVGGGRGVVDKRNRQAGLFRQRVAYREPVPAREVGWINHLASGEIENARRAQPDSGDLRRLQSRVGDEFMNRVADSFDNVFRPRVGTRRRFPPRQRMSAVVNKTDFRIRTAEIDPNIKRSAGVGDGYVFAF